MKILSQKLLSFFYELLLVRHLWAQTLLVYPGVQCRVLVYTMSLIDPCRTERDFLIDQYNFVC